MIRFHLMAENQQKIRDNSLQHNSKRERSRPERNIRIHRGGLELQQTEQRLYIVRARHLGMSNEQ